MANLSPPTTLSTGLSGAVTGTDLKWTASRNDLEREINAEKARTDLRDNPQAAGDDLKTEERRLAERLAKLRLDMHVMGGDGSCQVSGYARQQPVLF